MKKEKESDFSRLNQPMMVTKIVKANGKVLKLSGKRELAEVASSSGPED